MSEITRAKKRGQAARVSLVLTVLIGAGGLTGCGESDKAKAAKTQTETASSSSESTITAETSAPASASGGCKVVAEPTPQEDKTKLPKPSPSTLSGKWKVVMETNCGPITIRLDTKRSPKTSASFAYLTRKKFFDGLGFHRVVSDFVIQGGDPLGDGMGGPGFSVVEKPRKSEKYAAGTVAMAKTGEEPAGTSGSQFFIVLADGALPTPDYAVVGKLIAGSDTINNIAELSSGGDGPPSEPVVISKATLKKG